MEVITIQSEAYNNLISRFDQFEALLKHVAKIHALKEVWLDIAETCKLLKISKRTLQNYRDAGILTFSKVGGKVYFSAEAIEEHLKNHSYKAINKPKLY